MKKEYVRRITVFEDHFISFRKTLTKDALKKVYQVLTLIMVMEEVPEKFLKSIEGKRGLYEVRIEWGNNTYRVFCCFDEDNMVVLLNGFQKKTQRTPKNQLDKAQRLMNKYFEQKNNIGNGQQGL